ncbi:hypothetical protein [Agrobacterium pusense]|uniref:hypothetical protein n=1 Tax=Agrobacterium pusense TaxID=648995 RepID=UPI001C6F4680|nr:hypothetical protein [Agrobacterium pusense]MBW9067137.1 hypothetical protein [Agrobacterium pusense]MBW9082917.1 hypothetical protein [Agrobacterium pusense]MBW9124837.1 hypothetical protein [Agrobacterium pusense]MBW9135575.1 hypothetical protein [Agrobacterium pusense]
MQHIEDVDHREFLIFITNHCLKGKDMHQTSLMSSVFKLIQISRNLELEQVERDAAATLATGLANAAIKAHGPNSEFSVTLMSGIESLFDKRH